MLKINNVDFVKDLSITCFIDEKIYNDPTIADYFDKDGFELTLLEQEYYRAQGLPFGYQLNHRVCELPWIESGHTNLSVDHSMLIHRCDFQGFARQQIEKHLEENYKLNWLLNCRKKWGIDISLDWIDEDHNYEIVHIEFDTYNYSQALSNKARVEEWVRDEDWIYAAAVIWKRREEWQHLRGFDQNNWKARYFGWPKAELVEKSA